MGPRATSTMASLAHPSASPSASRRRAPAVLQLSQSAQLPDLELALDMDIDPGFGFSHVTTWTSTSRRYLIQVGLGRRDPDALLPKLLPVFRGHMMPIVLLACACTLVARLMHIPHPHPWLTFWSRALHGEELQVTYDTRCGILLYTFCLLILLLWICGRHDADMNKFSSIDIFHLGSSCL